MEQHKIRWAVYVNGYVHEDGRITDERLLKSCGAKSEALKELKLRINCFTVQQEYDGISWIDIENTETYL